MHLFTIKTTKKSRIFSISKGGFIGLGLWFHQRRSKIEGDKTDHYDKNSEPKRVVQRSYALMIPFCAFEIEVYINRND